MRFGKSNKAVTKATFIILFIGLLLPFFAAVMPLTSQAQNVTDQNLDSLVKNLQDPDKDVRSEAAWALGYLGDKAAVQPLIEALKDRNEDVRYASARALGNLGDKTAVPSLIAALKDPNKDVRSEVVKSLGTLRDKAAVPPLIAALRDPDRDVRSEVVWTLGDLGDKTTVPPLIAALKDPNKEVRSGSALVLGHLGDKAAVQPLIAALKDRNEDVRYAAARALGYLGDKAAVPPLNAALKDPDKYVRCEAARALRKLGQEIAETIRSECEGQHAFPPPPPPVDLKGGDKITAFWNTWFENRDEKTRMQELKKDATYSFVLDISKYAYFSDSSAEADSSITEAIEEARKKNKTTIRFRIRPILHGDILRFTDNQRPWEELKVDINKLVKADKNVEDSNEKKRDQWSSGEIKLRDFAQEVQAGEVRFDLLAERSGDATILITIWDEKGMIPLDHLSVSVRVTDGTAPTPRRGPVSDTFPLKAGRQTLLNVSSDFSTAGSLIADAAFYIFENSPKGKSLVLFAAKTGDAAPGTSDEISIYAWETVSLLSHYVEDRQQLIKKIRDARQKAISRDENVRKYSYQSAAEELREKIFSGLNERDQKQAAAAEKVFRDLVRQKDKRSMVFARMRNEDGNPVYLPLGLLAANSSSRILEKRIILVQPLPRERYPAGTRPVNTWTFNVPNTLPELETATNAALSQLKQSPPYRRDITAVQMYFEATEPPVSGAGSEGVVLLSHQAGGNLWFTSEADRITTEKIKRQFPVGSVAILSACSAAASEGNNQAILERLNTNGIDAMIISPFPVDAEYGAMLAIQFVQAIENARKNSQAFTVAELFSLASEQAAKHFKEKQGINFEDMDLEFLIAGDYRISIAPK